jgi:hypothetical protein
MEEISPLTDVKRTSDTFGIGSQIIQNLNTPKKVKVKKIQRVQTAEELTPLIQDTALENLIYFSDEATFHVSGYVHKQNCRIWSLEKPTIVN